MVPLLVRLDCSGRHPPSSKSPATFWAARLDGTRRRAAPGVPPRPLFSRLLAPWLALFSSSVGVHMSKGNSINIREGRGLSWCTSTQ